MTTTTEAMATEQLARTLLDAVARRDLDAVRAGHAPDLVEDFVAVGVFEGVEAVLGFFAELYGAVPDFTLEVLSVTANGGTAAAQWRATGTFTGSPFQGVHATGRRIELRGCDVMQFEDGHLKHNTIYYDGLGFARQIGMLPQLGSRMDRAMTAMFNARTDLMARLQRGRSR